MVVFCFTSKKLDKAIPGGIEGDESDGDIPGVGGISNVSGASLFGVNVGSPARLLLSEEGKNVRQLADNVKNALLKARSGGAVTDNEASRLTQELGQGLFSTDNDFRRGLKNIKDIFRDKVALIESGSDPDILADYRRQKGALTTEDSFFSNWANKNAGFEIGQKPQQEGGGFGSAQAAPAAPPPSQGFDPDSFLRN